MKFLLSILLTVVMLITVCALAEQIPEMTSEPSAEQQITTSSVAGESDLQIDFSVLQPDNPQATPVAVDPIDKPTPTPAPTPNFWYDEYVAQQMGVSFDIPLTWLLNPDPKFDPAVSLQFVEPQSEMMDVDGYQTRVTIDKFEMGLEQNADDALAKLKQTLTDMAETFTSFTAGDTAKTTFAGCHGYYCYYRAEFNDGTKNYAMNGRIVVFAKDHALYQVRLTTPRSWFTYYQYVYRRIRESFDFLS